MHFLLPLMQGNPGKAGHDLLRSDHVRGAICSRLEQFFSLQIQCMHSTKGSCQYVGVSDLQHEQARLGLIYYMGEAGFFFSPLLFWRYPDR